MSNRANAAKYGGATSMRSIGKGGGTSLMDVFTKSTPRQLQESEQQHETDFQKMMNEHEKAVLQLQSDLALKLSKEQAVIDLAKQNGVSPDDFANQLSAKITQNKLQELQNQNDANNPAKNPNIAGANQVGANSKAAMSGGLPPQAIIPPTVPQGAVGGYAQVPGIGMNQVQGSLVNQGVEKGGGFPMLDKNGKPMLDASGQPIMVGQTMLPTAHNLPGGISQVPGPIKITPDMVKGVQGAGGPSTTPDDSGIANPFNPYSNIQMPQGNANPSISNSMKGGAKPIGDVTQPSTPSNQPPTTPPQGALPQLFNWGNRGISMAAQPLIMGGQFGYNSLWSGQDNDPISQLMQRIFQSRGQMQQMPQIGQPNGQMQQMPNTNQPAMNPIDRFMQMLSTGGER